MGLAVRSYSSSTCLIISLTIFFPIPMQELVRVALAEGTLEAEQQERARQEHEAAERSRIAQEAAELEAERQRAEEQERNKRPSRLPAVPRSPLPEQEDVAI